MGLLLIPLEVDSISPNGTPPNPSSGGQQILNGIPPHPSSGGQHLPTGTPPYPSSGGQHLPQWDSSSSI